MNSSLSHVNYRQGPVKGLLLRSFFLFAAISIVICEFAWGGQTGKITGMIVDGETGEPLRGANVFLEGTALGASADLDGYYVILNVPPGTYALIADMMGYTRQRVEDLKVSLDVTTEMDFSLSPTILAGEEVVVTARTPIVQRDLTASKQIVRSEDISQMPVEEFSDVLELQAGVIKDTEGRIHIRGGRAHEVNYLIDGISVTDPFAGELSVEVENAGIEQFQVISGSFNAEYGQALSGVVEVVTKEGGEEYHGTVSNYVGDYFASDSDLFFGIDDRKITDITNFEASLNGPVPFFNKRLTFNVNGRYFSNKGWLYGQRRFRPQDSSNLEDSNPDNWIIQDATLTEPIQGLDNYQAYADTQDYALVPMNPFQKLSVQAKLAFRFSPFIKFSVGGLYHDVQFGKYSHRFKLNPDGNFKQFRNGLSITPVLNHSLSSSTFYTAKFSYLLFKYDRYVFEDALDSSGYVDPILLEAARQNAFYTGGTAGVKSNQSDKDFIVHRETTTLVGKFDVTSQVSRSNQVKAGAELKQYELEYEEFEIVPEDQFGPFKPAKPPVSAFNHNVYHRKPVELSGYIQDKIELKDMVINIGLRLDYFDAKGRGPTDFRDPSLTQPIKTIDIHQGDNPNHTRGDDDQLYSDVPYRWNAADDSRALIDPETGEPFSETVPADAHFIDAAGNDLSQKDWGATGSWFEQSEARAQVSPRVGISYPITDKGAIYFSYGFFYQKPTFEHLYVNPEFEMNMEQSGVVNTLIGNSNLKNQKTVNYEIGLQQQLGMNTGFFVTGFYKDINNWIGTEIVETYIAGDRYGRFINLDYGNVRGITIALDIRPTRNISAFIDYTFQIAEGNASNPEAVFADAAATLPRESEIQTVPLDWDQRHTLNLTTALNDPEGNWGIAVIGKLNTGKPYTPTLRATRGIRASFENSERKPVQMNFDIKGSRNFKVGTFTLSLFCKVFNLFDARNMDRVFSSTGRADFTSDILYAGRVQGVNTLEEWYTRPDYYTEPRRVQLGLNIAF